MVDQVHLSHRANGELSKLPFEQVQRFHQSGNKLKVQEELSGCKIYLRKEPKLSFSRAWRFSKATLLLEQASRSKQGLSVALCSLSSDS